jgi:hypothetical protein
MPCNSAHITLLACAESTHSGIETSSFAHRFDLVVVATSEANDDEGQHSNAAAEQAAAFR